MNNNVSIVVLTKNRPEYLSLCLNSIVGQKYNNLEYIVVDAGSDNSTLDLIHRYNSQIPLKVIPAGDCTIGAARQIGFKNSSGNVIAYIDSDVELPHDNWIEHMLEPFKYSHIVGVQTLAKCKETDHPMLKRVHSSFEYKYQTINKVNYEPVGFSHILIKKIAIADVNGFKDLNFREDTDLTTRIMGRGYSFAYLPDEKCYHYHVDGYKSYFNKLLRNKYRGALCSLRGIK